jgi:hypothetical protein
MLIIHPHSIEESNTLVKIPVRVERERQASRLSI